MKTKQDRIDEVCDVATNAITELLQLEFNKKSAGNSWSAIWDIIYHAVKCEAKDIYYHGQPKTN